MDFSRLPAFMDGFIAEVYPENFKTSLIKVHDDRLEKDFLPWAMTRSKERTLSDGAIQMERMLQGLWNYGGHDIVVDIKACITKPPTGELEIVVLDTLARVW